MRIAILSDLHVNYSPWSLPKLDADILLCPGDIADGVEGIHWLAGQVDIPTYLVAGNHDFYGLDLQDAEEQLDKATVGTEINLLNRKSVVLEQAGAPPLRLLGCTLWTDFKCQEARNIPQHDAMQAAADWSKDYRQIRDSGALLTPERVLALHERDRAWLARQLREPFAGTTIVITHNAPSALSIRPDHAESALVPFFAADAEDLVALGDVALWLHGHTHYSIDYCLSGTRILSNQRGRPDRINPDKERIMATSQPFNESLVETL